MPTSLMIRSIRRLLTVLLPFMVLVACSELVEPGVAIRWFTATKQDNGSHILQWRVDGLQGGSLTLEPAPGGGASLDVTGITNGGTGEIEVSPQTDTKYVLTAVSGLGASQTKYVFVEAVVPGVPGAPVIRDFSAVVAPVNPGLETTLRWQVDDEATLRLFGPGLGAGGVDVTGATSHVVTPEAGADYTLLASNSVGDVEASLTDVGRAIPAASFLIAGQSNAQGRNKPFAEVFIPAEAGVRMLGNDYVWQEAYEPLDDCTGQVDLVSRDPTEVGEPCNSGVSFGVSFGNEVQDATGGTVFLIPAAKGGSTLAEWQPRADRYARTTLFGSAAYRAQLAGIERGAPIGYERSGSAYGALLWYQGESQTNSLAEAEDYLVQTAAVFDAFQTELGAPIIFAQLGRIYERTTGIYDEDGRNLLVQIVRQAQLDLVSASDDRYLVVTHDLPMADRIHLSAEGQRELGRRMSLVYREHLLGGSGVNGTGPRLLSDPVKVDSDTVEVRFDRAISESDSTDADAYSGYFAVFSSGGPQLGVQSITRGPGPAGPDSVVVITLNQPTNNDVEVRYLPPELPSDTGAGLIEDVVRSATCIEPMPVTGLCLPAPAFGTAAGGVKLDAMQFEDLDTW